MKIICLWSGPRNVSTALMYSFGNRPDTEIIDEPLYAHYLVQSGADHPGKQQTLTEQENDGNKVIQNLLSYSSDKPVLFLKSMGHHFLNLDHNFLHRFSNIFLIRNPREMLPSLSQQLPNPILRDTALDKQVDLYKRIINLKQEPIIIDARHLLENPEGILGKVCESLDIPFYNSMLSWQAGARKEDGSWAKYWYHNVHKSTGFRAYQKKKASFPASLEPLLNECLPYYQFLYERSLKP
ncbi:sulfotransferase family protein [Fulvivirga aurantia]|uniref:sulfotransferase-like domain-containing protein n=1 Tax=Fulvivirga aurantia TaxID=2529383 RepID=UPI0012BBA69F|nr:sulfotransferase family protein [Fulvivirga aurantia]